MVDPSFKSTLAKKDRPRIVGNFLRERRQALGLSQRALGQMFSPAVTTQFISNVERGVTPLPPTHIPMLCNALKISEQELMVVLEREYASKLSGRLGIDEQIAAHVAAASPSSSSKMAVAPSDMEIMQKVYQAYRSASPQERSAFMDFCNRILGKSDE